MSRLGVSTVIVSVENLPIGHPGLTPSFACLCVGAHEQKDEPAAESCRYDSHNATPIILKQVRAALFAHIRSAILKTSQPKAAKPAPQKSMRDILAFPSFLQYNCALSRSWQVTNY